ncbi:MAG: CheR family methyltransferase [Bacillota bacterium]
MDLKINQLSEKMFQKISQLVYQEIGVNLPAKKKAMVNSRLSKRIRKLDISNFEDYYQYLTDNKSELVELFNALTTNVTHFFREKHHLEFLETEVFPEIKQSNNKKIRGWSAGCSSGEEPYSLAIKSAENFNLNNWDIKILATDINTEVLKLASQGIYRQQRVDKVPHRLLKKYFLLGEGDNQGLFKVKKELRDLIYFKRSNLNQANYPIKSQLDFIFCRNVFIYFQEQTRQQIINKFYQHLRAGGYLFLGHSESIRPDQMQGKWKSVGKTTYQKEV